MTYLVVITKSSVGVKKRKGVKRERILVNTVVAAESEEDAVLKANGGSPPDAGTDVYLMSLGKPLKGKFTGKG